MKCDSHAGMPGVLNRNGANSDKPHAYLGTSFINTTFGRASVFVCRLFPQQARSVENVERDSDIQRARKEMYKYGGTHQ